MNSEFSPLGNTNGNPQRVDWVEIEKTFNLLHGDLRNDETVELRQLPASSNPTVVPRVGYAQNFKEARALVEQALTVTASIYIGMNPRDISRHPFAPAVWKSARNAQSDSSAVTRCNWALLDCDPMRVPPFMKFNATAEERAQLHAAINAMLATGGMGDLVRACSGNGEYIFARIALPNNAETTAVYGAWLKKISKHYSGPHLRIDTTTDAARLVKLIGCPAYGKLEAPDRAATVTRWIGHSVSPPINENLQNEIRNGALQEPAGNAAHPEPAGNSFDAILPNDRFEPEDFQGVGVSEKLEPDLNAIASAKTVALEDFTNLSVLGMTADGKIALYVVDKRRVAEVDLTKVNELEMLRLVGPEFNRLVAKFGSVKINDQEKRCINFREFQKQVVIEARKTELGQLKCIGNGVWNIGKGIAVIGDHPFVLRNDGAIVDITRPILGGFYIRPDIGLSAPTNLLREKLRIWNQRKARTSLVALYKVVQQWQFRARGAPLLLTAMAAATLVQAIWAWRPMLWLTGESGAGKSLLMKTLFPLFGPSAILMEGATSEAALRQKIRGHSGPVLLDEFEQSPQRKKILELLRSSGRGGAIARFNASGGIDCEIRHLIWAASLDATLPDAADRNRWIVVELKKLTGAIGAPTDPALKQIGFDVLVSMVWAAPRALELEGALRCINIPGVQSRLRDNLIAPTAALCAILGYSNVRAERLLRLLVKRFVQEAPVENETDQEALLSEILSQQISLERTAKNNQPGRGHISVAQALTDPDAAETLQRFGIRVNGDKIFFAGNIIEKRMKDASRKGKLDLNTILTRLPGASRGRQRILDVPQRGVSVPCSTVKAQLASFNEHSA